MILLAHPTGNENVRAVLAALDQADLLAKFVTALGWSNASWLVDRLPANLHSQLARRGYDLPHSKIRVFPLRETIRLLAQRMQQRWLIKHERGWASGGMLRRNIREVKPPAEWAVPAPQHP